MEPIKRIVLDLLKPHDPDILKFTNEITSVNGVEGVNATLLETDKKVENIKLTIEGEEIDYENVEKKINDMGGTVHSIDEVACGEYIVEEVKTHQD